MVHTLRYYRGRVNNNRRRERAADCRAIAAAFRICYRSLPLPASWKFEVSTDCIYLRELFTEAVEEIIAYIRVR